MPCIFAILGLSVANFKAANVCAPQLQRRIWKPGNWTSAWKRGTRWAVKYFGDCAAKLQ